MDRKLYDTAVPGRVATAFPSFAPSQEPVAADAVKVGEGGAVGSSMGTGSPESLASRSAAAIPATSASAAPNEISRINMDSVTRRMRMEGPPIGGTSSAPGSARTRLMASSASQVQESAILAAMRRQMEALEEKLSGQITRVQQQSDRLRDVALSRVDSKMASMEALQPKLDRRLAELTGNYKGLSDEMQAQIRRIDQMDSRLWEWRHNFEEEMRGKFSEQDQSHQQLSSTVRVNHGTVDDLLKRFNKRMQRLEALFEERFASFEDTTQNLLHLHERVTEIEELRQVDASQKVVATRDGHDRGTTDPGQINEHSVLIASVESRLTESGHKFEQLQRELHEHHTRLHTQEERLKSLRTLFDTKEEHYRWLSDRVERADWEGRFKELQHQLHEMHQHRNEANEKVDLIHKKIENYDQMFEETSERIERVHARVSSSIIDCQVVGDEPIATIDTGDVLSMEVKECLHRVCDSEGRIDSLTVDIQSLRGDMHLLPRVEALVEQLKEVGPKILNQEECIKELHEKVGRMDVHGRVQGAENGTWSGASVGGLESAATSARIGKLEAEVAKLISEVHGPGGLG